MRWYIIILIWTIKPTQNMDGPPPTVSATQILKTVYCNNGFLKGIIINFVNLPLKFDLSVAEKDEQLPRIYCLYRSPTIAIFFFRTNDYRYFKMKVWCYQWTNIFSNAWTIHKRIISSRLQSVSGCSKSKRMMYLCMIKWQNRINNK